MQLPGEGPLRTVAANEMRGWRQPARRRGASLAFAILLAALATSVNAQEVKPACSIPKTVFEYGEVVRITCANNSNERAPFAVFRPRTPESRFRDRVFSWPEWIEPHGKLIFSLDTASLFQQDPSLNLNSNNEDPNRIRLRLASLPQDIDFFLVRTVRSVPGSISTSGRTTFQLGEPIETTIGGLSKLIREREILNPDGTRASTWQEHLWLQLIRLGHALPNGLATEDFKVAEQIMDGKANPARVRIPAGDEDWRNVWVPGPYELRLVDGSGAVIDRLAVHFSVPRAKGALSVTNGTQVAGQDPLLRSFLAKISLPATFPAAAAKFLVVKLFRRDDRGTLHAALDDTHLVWSSPLTASEHLGYARFAPGAYEVHLILPISDNFKEGTPGDLGTLPTFYSLDAKHLTIADVGSEPEETLPFGSAVLTVREPGPFRPLQAITVSASTSANLPSSRAASKFFLSLHRKAEYGPDCASILEIGAPLVDNADRPNTYEKPIILPAGTAVVRLPPELGTFELRLYQGSVPESYADRARFPPNALLARFPIAIAFPVDDAALPSSLKQENAIGETVQFGYDPSRFSLPGLVSSSIVARPTLVPGGAERAGARTRDGTPASTPFWTEGEFEVRLSAAFTEWGHVVFARRAFRIVDRRTPPFPQSAAYRASPRIDWPSIDDPVRGLRAIRPDASRCGGVQEPPKVAALRLVEVLIHDPDSADDDEYRAIDAVRPGYPFFVEARFEQEPSEASYRVGTAGAKTIEVVRTKDRKLYRSKILVLHEGATP